MLILSRKSNESVVVGHEHSGQPMLTVTVLEITGSRVRLGFDGDVNIPIHRSEVWERIRSRTGSDTPVPAAESAAAEPSAVFGPQRIPIENTAETQ